MLLRKVNAWLSLLITILILDHSIFNAVWMLSMGAVVKSESKASFMMIILMVIHAVISIALAGSCRKGAEKRKSREYKRLNAQTIVQRISGGAMLLFTALHVAGTLGIMQPPQLVHVIVPPLFFTIVLAHVAVSTDKAFITLGFGNAKFIKALGVAMKVLCIVTLIADVIGFYLYRV